ncbi:MAG: ATP-binding cassette domain-containing protein, partial [Firmicutes bacterium]|nr:ATP-binding cassette domain-containing protein [Bacillota bacterium]
MLGLSAFYQPLAKAVVIVAAASIDSLLLARSTKENRRALLGNRGGRHSPVPDVARRANRIPIDRSKNLLELEGISKRFGDIPVLEDVSLKIARGEVHALIGENGAGKSTLIKIITGVYPKDSGIIRLNG